MSKPEPTIIHKEGERSIVSYDDYKRLERYYEQCLSDSADQCLKLAVKCRNLTKNIFTSRK
jgi:hypothetical protein